MVAGADQRDPGTVVKVASVAIREGESRKGRRSLPPPLPEVDRYAKALVERGTPSLNLNQYSYRGPSWESTTRRN